MLYHLLAPLARDHILFNLFTYISFRAAGAMLTAILLAFAVGPAIIARLRARKIGQVVRAEGLASHQGKRGTPTMGGLIILLATVVPTLLWAPLTNRFVVVALAATLWTGAIGFVDDYLKIVEGKSRGLVAKWKLVLQLLFGAALGLYLLRWPVVAPAVLPATATAAEAPRALAVDQRQSAAPGRRRRRYPRRSAAAPGVPKERRAEAQARTGPIGHPSRSHPSARRPNCRPGSPRARTAPEAWAPAERDRSR